MEFLDHTTFKDIDRPLLEGYFPNSIHYPIMKFVEYVSFEFVMKSSEEGRTDALNAHGRSERWYCVLWSSEFWRP